MRQRHMPGEILFVDFDGQTIPIIDQETGVVSEASLFIAVLGASNYTFLTVTEGVVSIEPGNRRPIEKFA
jgi:transposase